MTHRLLIIEYYTVHQRHFSCTILFSFVILFSVLDVFFLVSEVPVDNDTGEPSELTYCNTCNTRMQMQVLELIIPDQKTNLRC